MSFHQKLVVIFFNWITLGLYSFCYYRIHIVGSKTFKKIVLKILRGSMVLINYISLSITLFYLFYSLFFNRNRKYLKLIAGFTFNSFSLRLAHNNLR